MIRMVADGGYALSEELGGYRVGRFDTDADRGTE
jgi:hypothetical protein